MNRQRLSQLLSGKGVLVFPHVRGMNRCRSFPADHGPGVLEGLHGGNAGAQLKRRRPLGGHGSRGRFHGGTAVVAGSDRRLPLAAWFDRAHHLAYGSGLYGFDLPGCLGAQALRVRPTCFARRALMRDW